MAGSSVAMLGLVVALAHAPARSVVLAIDVTALTLIPEAEFRTMVGETTAIWKRHGVILTWITAREHREPLRPGVVQVVGDGCQVEPLCRPAATAGDEAPTSRRLGAVVFVEQNMTPEKTLLLSMNAVTQIVERVTWLNRTFAELPTRTRGYLIGRALGRVLAHEIGHYLLAWRFHSEDGLMRSQFRADRLVAPSRREFELAGSQLPWLRLRLAQLAAEEREARTAASYR